jgi:hypothetical protein
MLDASTVDRRVKPGDEGREMSEFAIEPVSQSERAARFVIQALDVDKTEPRPDGPDRQEDQALPF